MRNYSGTVLTAVGIACLALFLGCQRAPTVTITVPSEGDTLAQGSIEVKARATDNRAISRVDFYVDNNLKGTDSTGDADTFRYTWDAASESLTHTIKAKAFDATGDSAEQAITVFVRTDYPESVRATIPTTDGHPQNLVCPRNTGRVYVTGEWDDAVYVIRTSDNAVIDTLRMGCGPTHIWGAPGLMDSHDGECTMKPEVSIGHYREEAAEVLYA